MRYRELGSYSGIFDDAGNRLAYWPADIAPQAGALARAMRLIDDGLADGPIDPPISAAAMLERIGFELICAVEGREAQEQARLPDPFGPEMIGAQLAAVDRLECWTSTIYHPEGLFHQFRAFDQDGQRIATIKAEYPA